MKTKFLPSLLVLFSFVACQKAAQILPNLNPGTTKPKPPVVVTVKPDTIPDKASFKLQLSKDSINTDETVFVFKTKSKTAYDPGEDAVYFMGNGKVNLASISSDGRDLAINDLPYTPGMSIGLDAITKSDGAYVLAVSYQSNIPASIHFWLNDTYLKDSLDVRTKIYSFNVSKADTNSFGKNRFKLVLR
jgi:hypothetical protein